MQEFSWQAVVIQIATFLINCCFHQSLWVKIFQTWIRCEFVSWRLRRPLKSPFNIKKLKNRFPVEDSFAEHDYVFGGIRMFMLLHSDCNKFDLTGDLKAKKVVAKTKHFSNFQVNWNTLANKEQIEAIFQSTTTSQIKTFINYLQNILPTHTGGSILLNS